MILKGSQRGGARQMARHLMNGEQNEHVSIHEIKGFVADTIMGALNEVYALSKGTQCKQFLYSLSMNPPQNEKVPVEDFEEALARIEDKLGLTGQPRVVVFHEKEGRRHAHCVWSRIDTDAMKAINLPYTKRKLMTISKDLFIQHQWRMPKGLIDRKARNPLNYSRAEWQQAARSGRNPKAIKAALQECWAVSDTRKAFEQALSERGYFLARGDRRGFVAVDVYGEVHSLSRKLGMKAKDLQQRLGDPEALPGADETRQAVNQKLGTLFHGYLDELKQIQRKELQPLLQAKNEMTQAHRQARAAQKAFQDKRWQSEESQRAARMRKGLKGVWDMLTGKYWKLRKQNEREAWQAHIRDQNERQSLIEKQLDQRQALQRQFEEMRTKHTNEQAALVRDLAQIADSSPPGSSRLQRGFENETKDHNSIRQRDNQKAAHDHDGR